MNTYTIYICKSIWSQPDIEIYNSFAKYLNNKGMEVTIKKVTSFELKPYYFFKKNWKFTDDFGFIQDNKSGSFWVLNFSCHVDTYDKKLKEILRDPRCRVFLKVQYRESAYNKYPFTKIKPWVFFEARPQEMQSQLENWRKHKRTYKSLYFRGKTGHKRREAILEHIKEKGVINPESNSVNYRQYLKESCQYKIILSLPGWGIFCHREIEGFGLGTPVLMPKLKNSLHNDLEPDYHYISVDVDTEKENAKLAADKIVERFFQVIDDHEYLDFVAKNAMQWYDENVRYPNCMELTARLLGLNK